MYIFLLTFFLLYGAMHLYVFLKARAAFAFGTGISIYIILFMLIMVLAPLIVRLSEKHGFEFLARLMSYAGYIWLGLLFLFFCVSIILDIYRLSIYLGGALFQKNLSAVIPSARFSFFLPLLFSICIAIYGYFEATDISLDKVTIKTSKIPKEIGRLKIVQISDVHLGLIVREERLKKILQTVKMAEPDILVSTGDLVDGQINGMGGLAELLQGINPRYGKFAITGNHEFYAGLSQAMDFTEKAGFRILRGEGLTVEGLVNIAGVDDPAGNTNELYKGISEKELLSGLPREKFTLLLKHRPLIDKNALGLFDLQLSGHTHKGQIFPFSLITWMYYPVDSGCLKLVDNCYMYVSRGAGTWGPPIRFLSPPEVTVVELVSQ
ncbi:MAG TPA: metallophosphoesterase [Thermodesulfovibrionia bacterium]|nr:metallophosphoesterase [Thermodesulfovibrionia bacterium]